MRPPKGPAYVLLLLCLQAGGGLGAGKLAAQPADDAAGLYRQATAFHEARCLGDASRLYRQVLALDPPQEPNATQRALALRYAPRLFTVEGEPFVLEDFAAVLHPELPLIGYHLFWDDDIDFPEDNDPTDHEIVWVAYDPATGAVTDVATYFHGQLLRDPGAVRDAARHDGRAWIGVEWGKHGSLTRRATGLDGGTATQDLRENWERLHARGTRRPDHPLARGWPTAFAGSWDDYRAYAVPVDPRRLLEEKDMILVSRWPNAVLDEYFLPYNFSAKPAWPGELE